MHTLKSNEPILKLPDLNQEFILQTDASNQSIGGCLLQMHEGVKHPVLYASKKLIPKEQHYSVGERQALAIVWAVKKFHRYLYGQHFTLESRDVTSTKTLKYKYKYKYPSFKYKYEYLVFKRLTLL